MNKVPANILILMVILISIVFLGCSKEDEDKKPSSDKSVEQKDYRQSAFLEEVMKEDYAEIESPLDIPMFRWDFSGKKVYSYTYEQEVRNRMNMGDSPKTSKDKDQSMTGNAELLIKSQGDHTANFVLRDMEMKMEMNLGEEDEPKVMEQASQPMVVQGMKEDGSLTLCDSSREMFIKTLFPLPPSHLKVGESVDVPAQTPFNAMGSLLQVTGRSRITLTRYVKIGKRVCAQLDTDVDISELNIPSELKGDYNCFTKGASRFFFDIEERCFTSGSIALMLQFSIDAPMPGIKGLENKREDMPSRAQMAMTSDNLIRVAIK